MTFRSIVSLTVCAFLGSVLGAGGAHAQTNDADLQKEVEELKKGQEAILKELQDIKKMLQAPKAPAPAAAPTPTAPDPRKIVIDVSGHPIEGDVKAPLTLVEFSDYQCPYCSKYHTELQPQIENGFVVPGKMRRVFLDLPLESLHPLAFAAAQASRCAGEQGKYFEMQHRLFTSGKALADWDGHAAAVGIDAVKYGECLAGGRYAPAVRADMAQAQRAGIQGTPSFLLARTDPAEPSKVSGVALLVGMQPYDTFKREIEQALSSPSAAK